MSESSDRIKVNLGCGTGKIPGFINVDIDPSLAPDQVYDIRNELPFQDSTVDEVTCFHTIEHIPKCFWQMIFLDCQRYMKEGGIFWLSFPEFSKCWENWKTNYRGLREFWEATIFGRGASQWDRHVAVADSGEIRYFLERCGFFIESIEPEKDEPYNTVIKAVNYKVLTYEQVLKERLWPQEPVS